MSCDEESDTGLIIYEMLYVVGVGKGFQLPISSPLREFCLVDLLSCFMRMLLSLLAQLVEVVQV